MAHLQRHRLADARRRRACQHQGDDATIADEERELLQAGAHLEPLIPVEPLARLDYAEVADPETLRPLDRIGSTARLLIAAWVGKTRLIDNLEVVR